MKALTMAALLAALAISAYGQGRHKTPKDMQHTEIQQQISSLYERMYALMISKDVAALGDMLSPKFELIHMTGMHQSKSVYLKAIANGTLNYYSATTENIVFSSIAADKVVILGQSRVNAAVFGGGRHTWPLQLKITFEKSRDKWTIAEAVASTY